MNRILSGFIFSLVGAAAFAGPEPNPPVLPPNIAVDINAPGAVRAELQISIPSLKEVQRYELSVSSSGITGGVYIPLGEGNLVTIEAFDEGGEPIYHGEGKLTVDEEITREVTIPLDGREATSPPEAKLGTYRLSLEFGAGEIDGTVLKTTLLDALGNHVPFKAEDMRWQLPDGFEVLPYSCFMDALCIDYPDPSRFKEIDACYRDFSCWGREVPPPPGGYVYVTNGTNHTCALTVNKDIRCWGDNQVGQLGIPTPTGCPVGGRLCSAVPVTVHCPSGQSCKYKSVAAGGNHTCAVDTNGKAWCWGEHIEAIGITPTTSGSAFGTPWHIEVTPQQTTQGFNDLVAIDTSVTHTCAVTAGGDVYCWGSNALGELGQISTGIGAIVKTTRGQLVNTGNKYQAVATGSMHTCAIQQNGLLDCWGDNKSFQLTGNANNARLITVTSKVPLLFNHGVAMIAAGASSTCTENAYQDAICWGSPANGTAVTNTSNAGNYLLRPGYTRSLATEVDTCGTAPCTRSCLTDLGGGLFCGNWRTNLYPAQLKEVAWPKGVAVISYNQVDVGPNHVCAVTTREDVWCFGLNTFGQFGTGAVSNVRTSEPATAAAR